MTEYAKVTVYFHDYSPFSLLFNETEEIIYREGPQGLEFLIPDGRWHKSNSDATLSEMQNLDEVGQHSARVGSTMTEKEVEEWLKAQA